MTDNLTCTMIGSLESKIHIEVALKLLNEVKKTAFCLEDCQNGYTVLDIFGIKEALCM